MMAIGGRRMDAPGQSQNFQTPSGISLFSITFFFKIKYLVSAISKEMLTNTHYGQPYIFQVTGYIGILLKTPIFKSGTSIILLFLMVKSGSSVANRILTFGQTSS